MSRRFDPKVLEDIVHEVLAQNLPLEPRLRAVTTAVASRYPGQIEENWNWVFSADGGATQQLTLLHVSLGEYVTIVGSPIPTGGFSGRYHTEIFDFILDGELVNYAAGDLEVTRYRPGDVSFLGKKDGRNCAIPDHLWMLEYARGPIPTMFALPVTDTLFGSLDFRSLFRMMWLATKQLLGIRSKNQPPPKSESRTRCLYPPGQYQPRHDAGTARHGSDWHVARTQTISQDHVVKCTKSAASHSRHSCRSSCWSSW